MLEKRWAMASPSGELVHPCSDCYGTGMDRTPFDYIMCIFLQAHLQKMVRLTPASLRRMGKPSTSVGEMRRFFGILVLAARYEFGARADLWASKPASKHIDTPASGRETGVPRDRFDAIWRALAFREQLDGITETSSTQRRWSLVQDFVDAFNEHRFANFAPSDLVCVDESMSRCYGQGVLSSITVCPCTSPYTAS